MAYLVMFLFHAYLLSFLFSLLKHQIRNESIFQNGRKHEQEAHYEKPLQGFDVRHLK